MKVVILGCGRVGSRLATLIEHDGHDVSIIDANPQAFDRLPETFAGQTVLGTGIDVDVLKSAGIEHADAFAAVTNFDNTNIMACEVAKEIFGVKHVLARIYDPGRESFYHELGLETVCPTTLVSTAAYNILSLPGVPAAQRQTAPLPRILGGESAGPAQPSSEQPQAQQAPEQAPAQASAQAPAEAPPVPAQPPVAVSAPASPAPSAAAAAAQAPGGASGANVETSASANRAVPQTTPQQPEPQSQAQKNGRGLRGLFRP